MKKTGKTDYTCKVERSVTIHCLFLWCKLSFVRSMQARASILPVLHELCNLSVGAPRGESWSLCKSINHFCKCLCAYYHTLCWLYTSPTGQLRCSLARWRLWNNQRRTIRYYSYSTFSLSTITLRVASMLVHTRKSPSCFASGHYTVYFYWKKKHGGKLECHWESCLLSAHIIRSLSLKLPNILLVSCYEIFIISVRHKEGGFQSNLSRVSLEAKKTASSELWVLQCLSRISSLAIFTFC